MNDTEHEDQCPRCGARLLRQWRELTPEEREVVRRLCAPDDASRLEGSRWCVRCWYQEMNDRPRLA